VLAVFPPLLADAIRRGVLRWLPGNLFVFVFVAAFFGAATTVMATGMLASAMLWLAAVYPAPTLLDDYLPYYFLLGFAEAWLNGARTGSTLMVVASIHHDATTALGRQFRRPTHANSRFAINRTKQGDNTGVSP
jgi:uncharacterized membrane protein